MINRIKDKMKINLAIDAIMLVLLMSVAGLGFLIKYVLVPGYKVTGLYQADVELYFMGLSRHEWGNIHLLLSFIFLGLMLLHIILHWKNDNMYFQKNVQKCFITKNNRCFYRYCRIVSGTGTSFCQTRSSAFSDKTTS